MTFHTFLVRCGVAALALAGLLVCVASSGAAVATPTSTHPITATRSGTSESAAGMAADQRIASDARIRLSDLPSGWMAENTVSRPTADAPCPGLRRAGGDISGGKVSPAFSDGEIHTAQSETYVYADTAMAEHWFAEFSSHSTRACLARLIRQQAQAAVQLEGFTVGSITTRSVPVAPVGDERAAFHVTVPVSGSGTTFKVEADSVFVRTGRGIQIFAFASLQSPFDARLERSLIRAASARLASDLRTGS
jgi:hypothetical protein